MSFVGNQVVPGIVVSKMVLFYSKLYAIYGVSAAQKGRDGVTRAIV